MDKNEVVRDKNTCNLILKFDTVYNLMLTFDDKKYSAVIKGNNVITFAQLWR